MKDRTAEAAPLDRARALLRGSSGDGSGAPDSATLAAMGHLVAAYPRDMWLWAFWQKGLLRAGDLDGAADACRALTADQATTVPGLLGQARLARAQGRLDLALGYARRAFERRATVESRMMLADVLAATGDRPAALALIEDGLATLNVRAFHAKRVLLLKALGRRGQARTAASDWLAAAPGDAAARAALRGLKTKPAGTPKGKTSTKNQAKTSAKPQTKPQAKPQAKIRAKASATPPKPPARDPRYDTLAGHLKANRMVAALALAETLLAAGPATTQDALALARGFARLNRRDLECAALGAARQAGLWGQPLTDHLLNRAEGFMPPDDLAPRIPRASRGAQTRIALRRMQAEGDHAGILALLRRPDQQPRTHEAAVAVYRALVGLARFDLARRYLGAVMRRWPRSVTTLSALFTAHVRYGDLDAAEALLSSVPGTDDDTSSVLAEKLRGLRLSLRLHRGDRLTEAEIDALLDTPVRDQSVCMTLMQHLIAYGHGEAVARLTDILREIGSLRQQVHWGVTPLGQQSTELKLTADRYGADALRALIDAPEAELRAAVRSGAWSIMLARFMIRRHVLPDVLADVGPDGLPDGAEAFEDAHAPGIPRVIYQYWDRDPPPLAVKRLMTSWHDQPGYRHVALSKQSATLLLREEFGRDWLQAFRMCKAPAEEADLLRYCLLWKYGGVWADADDMATAPLDQLLAGVTDLGVFREMLTGVITNNFIAARPGHPAMAYAAQMARDDILARSNETIWAKTGPGLLARAVAHTIAHQPGDGPATGMQIRDQSVLRRFVAIHNTLPHKGTDRHWSAQRLADPGYRDLVLAL